MGASGAALAKQLRPSFSGEVLIPGDEGYEAARTIWNAMIDKRPGLIARCASTNALVAAVRLARIPDLVVSVRRGGHGVSGKSLCEGGLTIDLGRMRRVSVDPGRQLVRVGAGCLLGDIDHGSWCRSASSPRRASAAWHSAVASAGQHPGFALTFVWKAVK